MNLFDSFDARKNQWKHFRAAAAVATFCQSVYKGLPPPPSCTLSLPLPYCCCCCCCRGAIPMKCRRKVLSQVSYEICCSLKTNYKTKFEFLWNCFQLAFFVFLFYLLFFYEVGRKECVWSQLIGLTLKTCECVCVEVSEWNSIYDRNDLIAKMPKSCGTRQCDELTIVPICGV